jgi:hypothetical protein
MAFIQPNHYVLSGGGISITYSTSGFDGKPHFSYHSSFISKTFTGDEIRVVQNDLGTLVSIAIMQTTDSGSTSFTLLVPRVNINPGESVNITTEGVTTHHRFSVVAALLHGQIDTYSIQQLNGSANHVIF